MGARVLPGVSGWAKSGESGWMGQAGPGRDNQAYWGGREGMLSQERLDMGLAVLGSIFPITLVWTGELRGLVSL